MLCNVCIAVEHQHRVRPAVAVAVKDDHNILGIQPIEHGGVRLAVIAVIARLGREGHAVSGADALKLLMVKDGEHALLHGRRGRADDLAIAQIQIDAVPDEPQPGRDRKLLVSLQLCRSGGKFSARLRQIGVFVAGQDGGVAHGVKAHLEIRPLVHQRIEDIARRAVGVLAIDRGALHRVVDQQARIVARDRQVIPAGKRMVEPVFFRIGVHPLRPARAGIARAVAPGHDQQHFRKLLRRHVVLRPEIAARTADNAARRAVGDVIPCPALGGVGKRRAARLQERVGAQARDELCGLGACDRRGRTEIAVVVAHDQPEIDQHPHGVAVSAGSAKSSSMDKISNQQAVFFMCPPPSAACFFSLHPV